MEKRTKVQIRKNMRNVKSSGSQIEKGFGRELWRRGFRYRKNNRKVFGKPDFTFKKWRVAIFCDGDFWHGKDWEVRKHDHKTNEKFWHEKIERNIQRDLEVNKKLKDDGWYVIRFWGSDIKSDLISCVNKVERLINEVKEVECC